MSDPKLKGGGEQTLTVALRVRPMLDDLYMGATQIAHKVDESMVVLMDPMEDPDDILRANRSREKQFVFDCAFDANATQEEVYKKTTSFLIDNVITGYNATVFAYGATGAGKTYTMLGTDTDPGIMALTLNDLFLEMEKTTDDMVYKVTMSYLEIYNEMIKDLLNPTTDILDLREDAKGGIQVAGLSEVTARSTEEVMKVLMRGNKERTQEPTAANQTSSRSHAVLQVTVKQQNRVRNIMQEVRVGKLFLIDLAGSERAANTLNRGKRMVEGAHINRSLLALGNCINALSEKNGPKYVNYRDSKLTRLLKDALGGNCKTVMIAHISPSSLHFEESRNTLVYADRAKHIKTKVRRNVTDVAYHIAQYTNIIQELREEIMRLRTKLHDVNVRPRGGPLDIQAVQSEVLEAKRTADREELCKLKEQLLISFKDQMELRKSLMELNNASMEISLETHRNQNLISEWDVERVRALRTHEAGEATDNRLKDPDKALDLAGEGTDALPEPEEVKTARDELKVLHDEKHRTEKIRGTLNKEVEAAKSKTRRLEESIPLRVNAEDQREILNLMCQVHELEIENTETQSTCLMKDFTIKKKDMVISRYRQHQSLCDQIIRRQRVLIKDHNVSTPKDLDELYELYRLEKEDKRLTREDSGNLSPEFRFKAPSVASNRPFVPGETEPLSTLEEESEPAASRHRRNRVPGSLNDEDKVFSRSSKARKLHELQLSGAWRNDSNLSDQTQGSGVQSAAAPKPNQLVPVTHQARQEIVSNTRSIAALAARKRNRAASDLLNTEKQVQDSKSLYRQPVNETESYLSPSVLAKHNKNFDANLLLQGPPSEDSLSLVTKQSAHTDTTLPPIRRNLEDDRLNRRRIPQREADRTRRYRSQENIRGTGITENGYTQLFAKNPPRRTGHRSTYRSSEFETPKTTSRSRIPTSNEKVYDSRPIYSSESSAREIDLGSPPLNDKGRRNTRQKRGYRAPLAAANFNGSDSSAVSTPQRTTKSKKPLPTIPHYRKGDITVMGFGLPRN